MKVIITGHTSGVGKSLYDKLIELGHEVWGLSRSNAYDLSTDQLGRFVSAIKNNDKYSGCTVHLVDEGVDSGPIVLQAIVKVNENDNEETLSKRILLKEHKIYPDAVNLFARKKIRISKRRVKILN